MSKLTHATRPVLLAYLFIVKQQYVMNMHNATNQPCPILYCRRSAKMRG